jgi:hypothetical protein
MRVRRWVSGPLWISFFLPTLLLAQEVPHSAQSKGRDREERAIDREEPISRQDPGAGATRLCMSDAVVCSSIEGFESYERLPDAALTSDEKLLIYYRPFGYKTALVDGMYQAHLIQDAQIHKRGQKAVLRKKLKLLDFKPRSQSPPDNLFVRNSISLKGLPPGDYDLTIILHDEVVKEPPATQSVKFRIVPAQDPHKIDKQSGSSDPKPSRQSNRAEN